ncbi:hypothetical protein M422DRAFT_116240, partial [Sphaerobolus stellatus SS14]
LRNHIGLGDLITERDAEVLNMGFKLTFFSPNDFFTNETLTKSYIYRDELGYEGDFVYERSEINWKDEKDLTKSFEIKKQRSKNTNSTRLIRKVHPIDSFFNFFRPPIPPSEDALENGEVDEEELEDLEERLELDYQIGEDLKERIIPHAVDWFTGKALEYEDIDMGDEDEFDDENLEEDSDEEKENDDE